ncbi:hypothetical protein AB0I02_18750 [Streptomyces phaeochromogenes]
MVTEIGNQVQPAAECLDAACNDAKRGDLAVLNLGHAGNAHPMRAATSFWAGPYCSRSSAS